MRLPRDIIPDVVPVDYPPLGFVPPFARELSERIENEVQRRSYLWANAILAAGLQTLPPNCTHFSAGFVSLNRESLQDSEWSYRANESFLFGGYVLVNSIEGNRIQQIYTIDIGGSRFPMVATQGAIQLQGIPPHPHTGSATCWVKSTSTNALWSHGILTCRHVVSSLSSGQSMTLHASTDHTTPTSATLADIDECTIDAAIVEIAASSWPKGLSPLSIHSPLSPADFIQFSGRQSNASGSILRIFQNSPYIGNLFGQRVIIDCIGIPGDSGALVETTKGEGVGLYMGTIPDGSGGREGICQDLNQAAKYFNIDLYC